MTPDDVERLAAEIAEVRERTAEEDLDLRRRLEFCEHELEQQRKQLASAIETLGKLRAEQGRLKVKAASRRAKSLDPGKQRQRAVDKKRRAIKKAGAPKKDQDE